MAQTAYGYPLHYQEPLVRTIPARERVLFAEEAGGMSPIVTGALVVGGAILLGSLL
jgi:hypothetical protein